MMCGIMSLFRQFEPTEPELPAEPPTAPSTPKSNTSGEVAQFRQFKSNGSGKSKTRLTNNNTKDTKEKNKKARRSTISILFNKNTRTFQGVTLAKALAWNAKKRVQKKMSREKLRESREKLRERYEKTKATLIQKRVRGMLVRMKKQKKKQKKKKISTKTVDQLMLRRSRARSLLGAEQEDTLIGKISTKKISTKTVDQLMLKRPGAKSLLGTDTVKSKHSGNEDSGIEEVDRLMRLRPGTPLRPDTPALSALGKSGGIRRTIAKIDSMMAKIKKTPDNDVRSRFSTGQSVVLWENNRWVPCTIVGWENNHWDIHKIGANAKAIANDDDLMPMTYVEESLASILKRKIDEINETMERIGAKQIEGFRITMETISKVIRKTMEEEHDAIWNRFQTSIQSLEARLGEIRAAALNHNSLMHQ
jgi:hypothetical protein